MSSLGLHGLFPGTNESFIWRPLHPPCPARKPPTCPESPAACTTHGPSWNTSSQGVAFTIFTSPIWKCRGINCLPTGLTWAHQNQGEQVHTSSSPSLSLLPPLFFPSDSLPGTLFQCGSEDEYCNTLNVKVSPWFTVKQRKSCAPFFPDSTFLLPQMTLSTRS